MHKVKPNRFKVVDYCNEYNKDCSEVKNEKKCEGECLKCNKREETYVNRRI